MSGVVRERLLFAALLALFVLSLVLCVREIGRTGLALPPVFVVQSPSGGGYPVVGGLRLERNSTWNELQLGDRIVRAGGVDLRGVSYLTFEAVVLAEAGTGLSIPVEIERDGQRRWIELRMQPYAQPWARIPLMLAIVAVGMIVLLRSPRSRQAQLLFAAVALIASAELPFYGGPRAQTYLYVALFNLGLPLGLWLWLRWAVRFPEGVAEKDRLPVGISWIVLVFPLARVGYHFGGPIPTEVVPSLVLASDALLAATSVGILTWNYLYADAIGRRQVKWVVYGGYIAALPLLFAVLVKAISPDPATELSFHRLFPLVVLAPVAIPVGLLIGIVRYNLFDIDRLLSATAGYSISIAVVLGGMLAVVRPSAVWLAEFAGLETGLLEVLVALALAVGVVALYRRVREPIDRYFFPERANVERGIQQLLRDLGDCATADEVTRLVVARLDVVMMCRKLTAFEVRDEELVPLVGAAGLRVGAHSVMARAFESHPWPVRVEGADLGDLRVELPAAEARVLDDAEARVVLPLRDGKNLHGLVILGPRSSGDVYTSTDLTLLGAVAERASAQLLRIRDARTIESERIRADELQALKDVAVGANEARSRFLAAASHDLRQPLHALGLFVDSLADQDDEESREETIDRIRGSTASLREMFDSLLDVSRLDVGAVDPQPKVFELDPLLARLLEQIEPMAKQKGLAISFERSGSWVYSDPSLVARIIRNLLTNAVRYTARGSISMVCRASELAVAVEVQDTGSGIPAERQREIFDEFTQLEDGKAEGLGLGLSIASRLAQLLGCSLTLDSEVGVGSTFRLEVPRAHASTCSAQRGPQPVASEDLAGVRVLVVDDDLEILEGMRQLLRRWGCEVVLAANLSDVAESLQGQGLLPDVLLADYRLSGGETGLEAIALARRLSGREIPAAIVSGESAPGGVETRGLAILEKPVLPLRLRALIVELLRR